MICHGATELTESGPQNQNSDGGISKHLFVYFVTFCSNSGVRLPCLRVLRASVAKFSPCLLRQTACRDGASSLRSVLSLSCAALPPIFSVYWRSFAWFSV